MYNNLSIHRILKILTQVLHVHDQQQNFLLQHDDGDDDDVDDVLLVVLEGHQQIDLDID